jgi:hypothetical protein
MQINESMDYVAHILNFGSKRCQLHTKAPLPLGQTPLHYWRDRPEAGLGTVNTEIHSHFSNENLMPHSTGPQPS